jgi:tetratricopeptide (TPR) repeat protein
MAAMTHSDPGARAALAADLTELRTQVGGPSFRQLASILAKDHQGAVSATTLRDATAAGAAVPKPATVFQFVTACRLYAERADRGMDPDRFDLDAWYSSWKRIGSTEDPAAEEELASLRSAVTGSNLANQHTPARVVGLVPREPEHFIHREQLTVLSDGLARGRVAVVVTGMRGAGKTQLAAAYAREVLDHGTGLVGWVNAETARTMYAGLAEIADHLGVAATDGDPVKSAHRLRDHLNNHSDPHLLVLDNATDPDLLRTITPTRGGVRVVITTADNAVRRLADVVIEAGTGYTPGQAYQFLRVATSIADDLDGEKTLALELGYLPLALAAAAATITAARPSLSYSAYLRRLRSQPLPSALRRRADADHPQSTDQAIMLSVNAAESATGDPQFDAVVRWLLGLFAVLAPSGVRRELLHHPDPDLDMLVDDGIDHCVRFSLLSWSTDETSVLAHRLTARVLLERARDADIGDELLTEALNLLSPHLFGREQAWTRRVQGALLIDQIDAIWSSGLPARAQGSLLEHAVRVRLWAVNDLIDTESVSRAIAVGVQTLAECEQILGPDHLYTVTSRNNLASAYESAGQIDKAITLLKQTLADTERIQGPDHPRTLISRNNLAVVTISAGQLDKAIALLQQNLADVERILGPDHPNTLSARGNLGRTYRIAGLLDEAITLYEQTAADSERILGPDHPETLRHRNNAAVAYGDAGQIDKAILLHDQICTDRQRILGPDHPETLTSVNNIAYLCESAGEVDIAIVLWEGICADSERILGPDHPNTLLYRNNFAHAHGVAYTLGAAGQLDKAISVYEQILADRERILGPDHPDTVVSHRDLAWLRDRRTADRGNVEHNEP